MMKAEQQDTRNVSRVRSFRFWFYLGLAATLLIWSNVTYAEEVAVADSDGGSWTISIRPSRPAEGSLRLLPPLPDAGTDMELASIDGPAANSVIAGAVQDAGMAIRPRIPSASMNGRTYVEIYRSIPYSKTEYYANPSYRHDATMEILFGQLRPGGGSGGAQGRIIENPVYSPYRPYLFAHWDWFQTHTLLRPRIYRPIYGAGFHY